MTNINLNLNLNATVNLNFSAVNQRDARFALPSNNVQKSDRTPAFTKRASETVSSDGDRNHADKKAHK